MAVQVPPVLAIEFLAHHQGIGFGLEFPERPRGKGLHAVDPFLVDGNLDALVAFIARRELEFRGQFESGS